jgi:hypothetical protein
VTAGVAGVRSHQQAGNLPAEVTSFVGRRQQISEAKRIVCRRRLPTVTGDAGVGKTRLALHVAAQMQHAFPSGLWLVELAALEDGKYACAVVASKLLAAPPGLQIPATSRQALRSSGEHLLEVPPLPVADLDRQMTTRTLARTDAVNLFAERAAFALPSFTVDASNRATVAQLSRRLELAIELAAVRVRALALAQILDRLDDCYFEFMAEGSRVAVALVQTLHTAMNRLLAVRLGDESALAQATRISGVAAFFLDDIPRAVPLFEDALAGLRATGERGGVWVDLLHLVVSTSACGDSESVLAFGAKCLGLVDSCGGAMSRSWALGARGIGRWTIGDLQEADRPTREDLPSRGTSPRRPNFVDSVPVLTTCGYLLMIARHKWGVHHHDDSWGWREAISGPRMRMPGPARPPGPGSWVV